MLEFRSLIPLIPEWVPKPRQLFRRIARDSRIKIPRLNGSSAQKQRFSDKTAEHRENSWVQTAAKSAFFPSLPLFSLEEVGDKTH